MKTWVQSWRNSPEKSFRLRGARSAPSRHTIELLERRNLLTSWVEGFGGAGMETPDLSQTIGEDGSIYLSGAFSSQWADFDPGDGVKILGSAGSTDGFISKFAADGSLGWARRFGGSGADEIRASSTVSEASGDYVYVTGVFEGTVDFGAPIGNLKSAGGKDVFVAKLDSADGSTLWAKRIGSKGVEAVNDIVTVHDAVTDTHTVVLTGSFRSTTDFDPGVGTAYLTPAGKGSNLNDDGFVLTLSANGDYLSAWRFGGTGSDSGGNIVTENGSIYLRGYVTGTVDLAPGSAVKNASGPFIAMYSDSSTPTWVVSVTTECWLSLHGDSLYAVGSLQTVTSTSSDVDVVVESYSKNDGTRQWSKRFGGVGNDYAGTLAVDSQTNSLYVGGNFFSPTIDFNPGDGGELINQGSRDGFLLKLDATTGGYQQVWQMGGAGADRARVIGIVGSTVYVQGDFEAQATFPTGGALSSAGQTDIFLMAFDQAPPAPALTSATTLEQGAVAQSALNNELTANDLSIEMLSKDLVASDSENITGVSTAAPPMSHVSTVWDEAWEDRMLLKLKRRVVRN